MKAAAPQSPLPPSDVMKIERQNQYESTLNILRLKGALRI